MHLAAFSLCPTQAGVGEAGLPVELMEVVEFRKDHIGPVEQVPPLVGPVLSRSSTTQAVRELVYRKNQLLSSPYQFPPSSTSPFLPSQFPQQPYLPQGNGYSSIFPPAQPFPPSSLFPPTSNGFPSAGFPPTGLPQQVTNTMSSTFSTRTCFRTDTTPVTTRLTEGWAKEWSRMDSWCLGCCREARGCYREVKEFCREARACCRERCMEARVCFRGCCRQVKEGCREGYNPARPMCQLGDWWIQSRAGCR